MLPLHSFSVTSPLSINELVALLPTVDVRTKIMAGGTDVVPNLKHGLYNVDRIISLKNIRELREITHTASSIKFGALARLDDVVHHDFINARTPAIASAASQIASPQIRTMGTVGGNICLDTRCLYFNQSEFWRSALGYCIKKDGTACHVVPTGKRCVAAASNDLATALLAYDATISILSTSGEKNIPLADFYLNNGEHNNILQPGEILTSATIDITTRDRGGFFKLRHRAAIDFPLLSVAVGFSVDNQQKLLSGTLVVNALVAKPKIFALAEWQGSTYNTGLIDEIAKKASLACHPQSNICDDAWRKQMVFNSVQQAFNNVTW